MSSFKAYLGEVSPHQERFSARYCSLFGESPRSGDILSNQELDGAVVFDGEAWRALDLVAMQKTINDRQDKLCKHQTDKVSTLT